MESKLVRVVCLSYKRNCTRITFDNVHCNLQVRPNLVRCRLPCRLHLEVRAGLEPQARERVADGGPAPIHETSLVPDLPEGPVRAAGRQRIRFETLQKCRSEALDNFW